MSFENVFHSTRCRLRALQKSELIALNEVSFESITEIWTSLNDDVWEHYRNLNLLHSTRCRLRALQKSETYCTQRNVVWEHYRNLNLLHQRNLNLMSFDEHYEIWTYFTQRDVVWDYRNLNLFNACRLRATEIWTYCTQRRLRALQKSELIALNEMSFESITEIWTYCTQRDVVREHYRISLNERSRLILSFERNVVDYRNLKLIALNDVVWCITFESLRLQKSELIALNEMSFESITEIWTYCTQRMSFESITEILTFDQRITEIWT